MTTLAECQDSFQTCEELFSRAIKSGWERDVKHFRNTSWRKKKDRTFAQAVRIIDEVAITSLPKSRARKKRSMKTNKLTQSNIKRSYSHSLSKQRSLTSASKLLGTEHIIERFQKKLRKCLIRVRKPIRRVNADVIFQLHWQPHWKSTPPGYIEHSLSIGGVSCFGIMECPWQTGFASLKWMGITSV